MWILVYCLLLTQMLTEGLKTEDTQFWLLEKDPIAHTIWKRGPFSEEDDKSTTESSHEASSRENSEPDGNDTQTRPVIDHTSHYLNSERNIYEHVNWGNNDSRIRDLNLYNGFAYFGMGTCEKKEVSLNDIQLASSPKNIIYEFAKILRVHCNKDRMINLMNLFELQYIQLKKDHSFNINLENMKLKKEQILRNSDSVYLAFRISVASQIYISMKTFPVAPNTPNGEPMSDYVFFIVVQMLGMLDIAIKELPELVTKFSQEFGNLCNTLIVHSVDQAQRAFTFKRYSKHQRQVALNDLLTISVIKELFLNKSTWHQKADLHDWFMTLYRSRKDAHLKEIVALYSWIAKKMPLAP